MDQIASPYPKKLFQARTTSVLDAWPTPQDYYYNIREGIEEFLQHMSVSRPCETMHRHGQCVACECKAMSVHILQYANIDNSDNIKAVLQHIFNLFEMLRAPARHLQLHEFRSSALLNIACVPFTIELSGLLAHSICWWSND